MSNPVVVVVGAGPGVGGSVARRFGRGDDLRSEGTKAVGHAGDITDTEAFNATPASISESAG